MQQQSKSLNTSSESEFEMIPSEGKLTRTIERQTAKVPSVVYLGLAFLSMGLSLTLASRSDRKDNANFVGLWAPTFLLLGLYNKIVKTQGSDRKSQLH